MVLTMLFSNIQGICWKQQPKANDVIAHELKESVNPLPKFPPNQRNCIHLVRVTSTCSALHCKLITHKVLQRCTVSVSAFLLMMMYLPEHLCGSVDKLDSKCGCILYDSVCLALMAAQVSNNKPIAFFKWTEAAQSWPTSLFSMKAISTLCMW